MLMACPTIFGMTPWEVIEEALVRRRPVQNKEWLARQLGVKPQAIGNWRERGVPPGRFRALGKVLQLTVDQIEGEAPLPWDKASGWPFPGIDEARFQRLHDFQKGEIQSEVRKLIEKFERESAVSSGGATPTGTGTHGKGR